MINPTTSPLQALARFEKLHLRITDICWLASLIPNCNGRLANIHEDFDVDFEEVCDALGLTHPDDEGDIGSDDYYIDRIIEEGKFGFLARVETPYVAEGRFSWGHTVGSWIYGETIQELELNALNWLIKVRGDSGFERRYQL